MTKYYAKVNNDLVTDLIAADDEFIKSLDGEFIEIPDPSIKRTATIGGVYDRALNKFYDQKPFKSWTLSLETLQWIPPVPMPTEDPPYIWDEDRQAWIEERKRTLVEFMP